MKYYMTAEEQIVSITQMTLVKQFLSKCNFEISELYLIVLAHIILILYLSNSSGYFTSADFS